AGDHRKAGLGEAATRLLGGRVDRVACADAGRAEDRDARSTDLLNRLEPAQELVADRGGMRPQVGIDALEERAVAPAVRAHRWRSRWVAVMPRAARTPSPPYSAPVANRCQGRIRE